MKSIFGYGTWKVLKYTSLFRSVMALSVSMFIPKWQFIPLLLDINHVCFLFSFVLFVCHIVWFWALDEIDMQNSVADRFSSTSTASSVHCLCGLFVHQVWWLPLPATTVRSRCTRLPMDRSVVGCVFLYDQIPSPTHTPVDRSVVGCVFLYY